MTDTDERVRQVAAQLSLPGGVGLRAWRDDDYAAVRDLAAAEGWSTLRDRPADGLAAWRASWPALVTTHAHTVVGFARALTDGAVTIYLADLLVAPAWRGQGLGRALIDACHLLLPSTRIDLLSTTGADEFYRAQGFRAFPGFRKSAW